jgi:hypothetical protein
VVVEDAVTIKGSTAQSASFCLLTGASSRDAPDPVDMPKPSLGNGNWDQTLFGVRKVSRVIQGIAGSVALCGFVWRPPFRR